MQNRHQGRSVCTIARLIHRDISTDIASRAKRFSRLKAKLEAGGNNDTEESRNGETASPEASAKKAKQRNTPKKPASKKRKVEETEETPEAQDTVKEENE